MTPHDLTRAQTDALLLLVDRDDGRLRLAKGTDGRAGTINSRVANSLRIIDLVAIVNDDGERWVDDECNAPAGWHAHLTAAGWDLAAHLTPTDHDVVTQMGGTVRHTAEELWTCRLVLSRPGLAALKQVCGCTAAEEPADLTVVQFAGGHVAATDSYVACRVPLDLLAVEVDGQVAEPVHVPAAVLKHALWRIGKDDTADVTISPFGVTVEIRKAHYTARVAADTDVRFPDLADLIGRAAAVHPSDDYTFIDASRMGQVANVTPNGTTVVSRGALAAATVHDYVHADRVVGVVMPVRTDFQQPMLGEATPDPVVEPPLFDDEDDQNGSAAPAVLPEAAEMDADQLLAAVAAADQAGVADPRTAAAETALLNGWVSAARGPDGYRLFLTTAGRAHLDILQADAA